MLINNTEIYSQVENNIDQLVENGVSWSVPVTHEEIEKAKSGFLSINIAGSKSIPRNWLPENLRGVKTLCLAGAGGQQAPLLAAAGADVTVIDLSEKMLEKDAFTAKSENLRIKTVHGNMCDLSGFENGAFDLIINPVSLIYVPDVSVVFRGCHRVLRQGGTFIMGAPSPVQYLCDFVPEGNYYVACNRMPYISYEHKEQKDWIEFGHTMEDYIGGQIAAGFVINGYFEEQLGDITELSFVTKATSV